jgi:shikimate 5-dehydrogenase
MLAQARTLGFTTLDGIPMVINQGVAAFSWVYEETLREKGVAREVIENIMRDIVTIPNGVS